MKIYTQTFDVAKQSPKRFWVAPYSDFKIGVKIVKNGTPIANEFTVKKNGVALEADEDKVDGFTTFTLQSAGKGNVEYAIEVSGVGETMKLVQIITDSTVFEVGGEGGSGGVENLGGVEGIMKISQADYNALIAAGTTNATTCYLITE